MSLITGMASYYNEIGAVLQQWADIGIFSYVLPFLLIFAIIIALLDKVDVFKDNRGVSALIALSIALLSLQFDLVPQFFSIIFPKLGVGLSILLVALILMGIFLGKQGTEWVKYIFFGIAIIIFIAIVLLSFSDYRWLDSWWWNQYSSAIIALIALLVIVIVAMTVKGGGGGGGHPFTIYPGNH